MATKAAKSSTVMVQKCRSAFVHILPDYIVGPPNLRVLLTVNHIAAELLRLVRKYVRKFVHST